MKTSDVKPNKSH